MQKLLMLFQLFPALVKAIIAAEEFIPLPGTGKQKLDLIISTVTEVYSDAKSIVPEIVALVGKLVNLANSLGVFKKTPAPDPNQTQPAA